MTTFSQENFRFLKKRCDKITPLEVLEICNKIFKDKICLVSSFGTEAAVLLDLVARINKNIKVFFIDTQKLFPETLLYKDSLIQHLGLTNVDTIYPSANDINKHDSFDMLWSDDPDQCCYIRKVKPLKKHLRKFDAWINGRKKYHGFNRSDIDIVEFKDNKVKINPLANFTATDVNKYLNSRNLPTHPLLNEGYLSVGCAVCTSKSACSVNARQGRWKGKNKTECGIHR